MRDVVRAGGGDEAACEEEVTDRAVQDVDLQGALASGGDERDLPVRHQGEEREAHEAGYEEPGEADQPELRAERAREGGWVLLRMEAVVPGTVDDVSVREQAVEGLRADQHETEEAERRQEQDNASIGTL